MRCEADLDAAAGDPAEAGMALGQVSRRVAGEAAISEAGGAEDQHIADRDAGTAA